MFDIYHDNDIYVLLNAGCPYCAIITDKPLNVEMLSDNITVMQVADINTAYWKFVDFYRSLFNIPVVGVTGTCGKTTTKEMIVHILSENYKVNATHKSLNADFRHLGYLLDINDDTQAGVFEMGVAAPGDLKRCCRYFKL
jgi:UDP-N-acetylmuramoyl-tripeptide--D-alanyl-D-alanine ligase